jgi:hypothetical protein
VSGPAWPGYLLAAVMIVTAGYCVTRLVTARLRRRPTVPDVDLSHVATGVAMAGMLVPSLRSLPDGAWEVVFAAALGWFGWRLIRAGHGRGDRAVVVPHLVASGVMLYMFLAVSPAGTVPAAAGTVMGGQSAGTIRFPVLALVFAVALLGYAVRVTDRLPALAPMGLLRLTIASAAGSADAGSRPAVPLSPRLAAGCEIVTSVTMGYLLMMML